MNHSEGIAALVAAMLLSLVLGVRWYRMQREKAAIARRLSNLLAEARHGQAASEKSADKTTPAEQQRHRSFIDARIDSAESLLAQAGFRYNWWDLYFLSGSLFLICLFLVFVFNHDWMWGAGSGVLLAALPWILLSARAHQRRQRFTEQLPNALDLFVSILRSGHSIPQAVRAVAEEIPAPCGNEFAELLQRMNLGQSLPQALAYSANRFKSFDLDLIRRACEIQMEVGGSLAELLDKTNGTLRQRLKLEKQVSVLTAPGRLSAVIIFVLPFVIATVFSVINPGYMSPLTDTKLGRGLLCLAFAAQLIGYLIMRRLASFKV